MSLLLLAIAATAFLDPFLLKLYGVPGYQSVEPFEKIDESYQPEETETDRNTQLER
jgi:hypothetical protein